jgi:hypothetical protein
MGANDCKCSWDQRLNVPSEARYKLSTFISPLLKADNFFFFNNTHIHTAYAVSPKGVEEASLKQICLAITNFAHVTGGKLIAV